MHGSNGEMLDISQFAAHEKDTLHPRLEEMFPDMHNQARYDLEPLVFGSMERIGCPPRPAEILLRVAAPPPEHPGV